MSDTLTLNVEGKCGEKKDEPKCSCSPQPPGITASKVINIRGVTNFSKYTHSIPNGTFKLSGYLQDGDKIGLTGAPIENVKEVSVYYWNGADTNPILLGITKDNSGNTTTSYYGRNDNGINDWISMENGLDELEALDEQNCKLNDAVPFEIQDSTSGSLPKDSKSPPSPPGSNYTVKAQKITDSSARDSNGTKISRVTLNGRPINISTPPDATSEIRLYSSPANKNVPIMFELKPPGNGNSKWFYSTDRDGNSWQEDAGNNFYSDNQLTEALAKKLDAFTCEYHKEVTIDLSFSGNGSYCCDEHVDKGKKNEGKVSVSVAQVSCQHRSPSITVKKHSITTDWSISGIKYNEGGNGQVRMITASELSFPVTGVKTVHAFYCGEVPKLIYLEGGPSEVRGKWFENNGSNSRDGHWTEVKLSGITPGELNKTTECQEYNQLVEELRCNNYRQCNDSTKPLPLLGGPGSQGPGESGGGERNLEGTQGGSSDGDNKPENPHQQSSFSPVANNLGEDQFEGGAGVSGSDTEPERQVSGVKKADKKDGEEDSKRESGYFDEEGDKEKAKATGGTTSTETRTEVASRHSPLERPPEAKPPPPGTGPAAPAAPGKDGDYGDTGKADSVGREAGARAGRDPSKNGDNRSHGPTGDRDVLAPGGPSLAQPVTTTSTLQPTSSATAETYTPESSSVSTPTVTNKETAPHDGEPAAPTTLTPATIKALPLSHTTNVSCHSVPLFGLLLHIQTHK
ncbi:hypothetical protein BEWA_029830 [Theileria equi strain WA]|uniref:Uncharacterized protein n=1 Tax=Theileria equi strain WA TaxID=1537102 RepID=L0AX14_THEEQ|nr:hypothetical protein BEWA_029830 [Theileria equi strain WA]AFZ80132.1 hypothetical protein BEWA_029830 [Theileria equi strain WA]|eukprot:XP_004829798.1 hypothetical protein BEWA_029830 [Theileria equi strain WA]